MYVIILSFSRDMLRVQFVVSAGALRDRPCHWMYGDSSVQVSRERASHVRAPTEFFTIRSIALRGDLL